MAESAYRVIYRCQECSFVPTEDVPFHEMHDLVEGKVLYIEDSEYNPISWYKPIVVKKSDLLFVHDDKYTNCDNCDVQIDCEEEHIFCIYKGEQSNPDEEMTLCEVRHHDLKSEFESDGFQCDDWELEDVENPRQTISTSKFVRKLISKKN